MRIILTPEGVPDDDSKRSPGCVEMRKALLIATGTLIAACTVTPEVRGTAAAAQSWPLLSPATLGSVLSASQRLRAAYADQELSLDCAIDVTAGRITVIGLAPAGPRVFTVIYDGQRVNADTSAGVPAVLKPERLLNDLQLALWPQAALEQAFDNTRWRLAQPDPRTRRLLRDGKLVAEVHYADADPWNGRLWLVNFDGGYSIAVESQRLE
jgi:hypothetical protein